MLNYRNLPLVKPLARSYTLSWVVVVLMVGLSLAGLLFPRSIYPTEELRRAFVANDAINLFLGVPILLGCMWLTRGGELAGLLAWPGALFYTLYNSIAYVIGIPLGWMTAGYLVLVSLCAYAIIDLLARTNQAAVSEQLGGAVPVRTSGWVLVIFGVLFLFRAASQLAPVITSQTEIQMSEIGVLIADTLLSVVWIAGGILLLKRKPLGYTCGLGLLFGGSMLFVGLVLFLLMQTLFTDSPSALVDAIVVLGMGLIFFIPFGLYLRGVQLSGRTPPEQFVR